MKYTASYYSYNFLKILALVALIFCLNVPLSLGLTNCYKAKQLVAKGRYSKINSNAIKFFYDAIQLCPGNIEAYEYLGNKYRKLGKNIEAIKYFIKAAVLGSNNYKLYFLLANQLFIDGTFNESYKYIKKSLEIKKNYPKSVALHLKILEKIDSIGPQIIIYEPSKPRGIIRSENQSLTVRGMAIDKSGVLSVRINNSTTLIDSDGHFLKDIPLLFGSNSILVEAEDKLGNYSSISMVVDRLKSAKIITEIPNNVQKENIYNKIYAVVIGINNYEKWPPLEFAVNDAISVAKKFRANGADDVTLILDQEATRNRILTVLGHELPRTTDYDDLVIIYFAGHGQTEDLTHDNKMGYIIPVDADTSNYFTNSISMEQVRSLSSRIPAKHILYVMDSCYSGLGLNRSIGFNKNISGYLKKIASMRAVQVITAGGEGEQVQERSGHGLFTQYFLKALSGEADLNHDGIVTGTELGSYIRPQVSIASQNKQTPLFGRLEGEGDVLFFISN